MDAYIPDRDTTGKPTQFKRLAAAGGNLPAVPPADRSLPRYRPPETARLPGLGILGTPGPVLRRSPGAGIGDRPRPGSPWLEPHRPDVYGRRLREFPLPGAAPDRLRFA